VFARGRGPLGNRLCLNDRAGPAPREVFEASSIRPRQRCLSQPFAPPVFNARRLALLDGASSLRNAVFHSTTFRKRSGGGAIPNCLGSGDRALHIGPCPPGPNWPSLLEAPPGPRPSEQFCPVHEKNEGPVEICPAVRLYLPSRRFLSVGRPRGAAAEGPPLPPNRP